ncbi:SAM-dependent methyltransferase [Streptomyces huasconensis]|uniref:SAM-dependent methyltransferase n=1 Tax=Streptomyces huasconensis TaxID=1854574 RepID=UPI0036F69E84
MPTHLSRAHSFSTAATPYAAHRPSYPPALFDAIEHLAGRPLAGARGGGRGCGDRHRPALLAERGADVLAVEPGRGMAREFRATPWADAQAARIARFLGRDDEARHTADRTSEQTTELDFRRDRLRWTRRVTQDAHLSNLATHSAFLVLGEDRTATFLNEERAELRKVFPDGIVEEAYVVDLLVATRP